MKQLEIIFVCSKIWAYAWIVKHNTRANDSHQLLKWVILTTTTTTTAVHQYGIRRASWQMYYRFLWNSMCVVWHFRPCICLSSSCCMFGWLIHSFIVGGNTHMIWRVRLRSFVNTCPFWHWFYIIISSIRMSVIVCMSNVCAILCKSMFVFVDHLPKHTHKQIQKNEVVALNSLFFHRKQFPIHTRFNCLRTSFSIIFFYTDLSSFVPLNTVYEILCHPFSRFQFNAYYPNTFFSVTMVDFFSAAAAMNVL